MTLTTEIKQRIIGAMLQSRSNFEGSDAKYATSLGVHKSAYVQIKNGKTDRVLSDVRWIGLARRLNVQLGNESQWQIANTPVFIYITKQLEFCQKANTCGIFCDKSNIGKTVAGKDYVRKNKNAVYVDCSQVKSKQKLVRYISQQFGLDHSGKYSDVFEDLVFYLKVVVNPLVILDEAGDLDYSAFLELKAMWNATEGYCGWYMMGAEGLESKIKRGIGCKKVGFTEIFRRYGSRYQNIVPKGDASESFLMTLAVQVIKANATLDAKSIEALLKKTNGSLTRIQTELKKLKRNN